ncbi:MAG: GNAT family N-acetyltransferase [Armatimonadetes bacterium]|nr:GNAT family N-acetyltransferase [Armatimonadota bacterium]
MSVLPLALIRPEDLLKAWRRFVPERYQVDLGCFLENGIQHPTFWETPSIAITEGEDVIGFILMKKSPADLYSGPSIFRSHISAMCFQDLETGCQLIEEIKDITVGKELVLGQDHGHIFPGAPDDWPELNYVLESSGFQTQERVSVDVEANLQDLEWSLWMAPLIISDWRVRRATPSDERELFNFMHTDFPGRWEYDVFQKCSRKREHEDIFILTDGFAVEGFAYTQSFATTKTLPIAGGVWHQSLGEKWGSLGPIGVSQKVRGQKLGGALLAASLNEMKKSGVEQCIIDWTNLINFYAKFGFKPTRNYITFVRPR